MPLMVAGKLTAKRLRELFSYDSATGIFVTLKRRGRIQAGVISGFVNVTNPKARARMKIGIDGAEYFCHRLAWLYVYGDWPDGGLDHINGDSCDNRIGNLREATQQQNTFNSRRPITNKSGFKGVSWHRGAGRWQAHIKSHKINRYLGLFDSAEKAHQAYAEAAILLNGEFARAA